MKPDTLLTWPLHVDYPLWRRWLKRERYRLDRVLITFTNHHVGENLSEFVREDLCGLFDVNFLYAPEGDDDWRDRAVNLALSYSFAEWVWFTEQDFTIVNDKTFWRALESDDPLHKVALGWQQDGRWHPSCLFVRRSVIDRTSRYFGPEPTDHFGEFGREVELCGRIADLREIPGTMFRHMAGLSQNHTLLALGEYEEGIYHPEEFRAYLRECLKSREALHPAWEREVRDYLG